MAHDHSAHSHDTPSGELQSKTGMRSAFLLVAVIAGLFIASLNFMQAMGGHEETTAHGGHEASVPAHHEASSNQTTAGEHGNGVPAENVQHDATLPASGGDSLGHENVPAHH